MARKKSKAVNNPSESVKAPETPLEALSTPDPAPTPLEEKPSSELVSEPPVVKEQETLVSPEDVVSHKELLDVVSSLLEIPPVIYLRWQSVVAGTNYHTTLRSVMQKLGSIKRKLAELNKD